MSTLIPSSADTPASINTTIAFEDEWIIINGRRFAAEPELPELAVLLGEPPVVARLRNKRGSIVQTCYAWPDLGILSTSPYIDYDAYNRTTEVIEMNKTRERRISVLWIYTCSHTGLPSTFEKWEPDWKGSLTPFSGSLTICGLHFKQGLTAERLKLLKRGTALEFGDDEHSAWATTPQGFRVSLAVAASDYAPIKEDLTRPIGTIQMFFEPWRNPRIEMLHLLDPGEEIVNSVMSQRDIVYSRVYFDGIITNRRLIIKSSSGTHHAWSLTCAPKATFEHGVHLPPSKVEWLFIVVGGLVLGLFLVGAYIFWTGLLGKIMLAAGAFTGFLVIAGSIEQLRSPSRVHGRVWIKAKDSDDISFVYYPARSISSPCMIAAFFHRLKQEATRISSAASNVSGSPTCSITPSNNRISSDYNHTRNSKQSNWWDWLCRGALLHIGERFGGATIKMTGACAVLAVFILIVTIALIFVVYFQF